jgi:serine/threonine-protein kinase
MPSDVEGLPRPGTIVAGKYRVDRVLGVGGMGCVVAATHVTLDQPVAIKILLDNVAKNPKNLQRFTREAQAAARIKSDHVAKVTDVGSLDDGTPFMVMEYLEGEDMAARLERGALPVDEAVRYVLQASEALAEAHQAGIVHRDLKPANLYLARRLDGSARVKVLDFGISKILGDSKPGADLTRTSALMGSPLYMSPEQMMSAKNADHRTDVWALGCILFELVTGQPPFIGATLPEICTRILNAPPTPLAELYPAAPAPLVAGIARCLAKTPEERFQNLGELASTIAPLGGEEAIRSAMTVRRVLGLPADERLGTMRLEPGSLPPGTPPMSRPPQMPAAVSHAAVTPPPGVITSSPEIAVRPTTLQSAVPRVGASTGAPVSQTWSGEGRKSRAPIVIAVSMAALAVVSAVVLIGGRLGRDETAAVATAAPATAAIAPAPAEPDADHAPVATGTVTAAPVAPPATASPEPPAAEPPPPEPPPEAKQPAAPPPRPKAPPPPPRQHTVKPGDDLFNTK